MTYAERLKLIREAADTLCASDVPRQRHATLYTVLEAISDVASNANPSPDSVDTLRADADFWMTFRWTDAP